MDKHLEENYQYADSLFTLVIQNSESKLSKSMPIELNPYYYRGQNDIELGKYQKALEGFKKTAADSTVNVDILLSRTEAYRMSGNTIALLRFVTACLN
jgi:tetratricopeptide (TPR) repeat protein